MCLLPRRLFLPSVPVFLLAELLEKLWMNFCEIVGWVSIEPKQPIRCLGDLERLGDLEPVFFIFIFAAVMKV